jgi:hypothetical protein
MIDLSQNEKDRQAFAGRKIAPVLPIGTRMPVSYPEDKIVIPVNLTSFDVKLLVALITIATFGIIFGTLHALAGHGVFF